jgi:hypothetical protein
LDELVIPSELCDHRIALFGTRPDAHRRLKRVPLLAWKR